MADKRSIFEDVSETKSRREATPQTTTVPKDQALVRLWLKALFVLVCAMILVGGLTRLTDSGLSITEWAPIKGMIPPMSTETWQSEFEKYQQIPEFHIQNASMTLAEFKYIYWWEWSHRQLGRLVGLLWAIGYFGFLLRRSLPRGWPQKFLFLGFLGGLQGAIGWWMVSSGLTGRMVDVASYRLAIHLGLAFFILGWIVWFLQSFTRGSPELLQARRRREGTFQGFAGILVVLVFFQILLGALVAGLDAGRGYTDWPMMAGQVVPDGIFNLEPVWLNFFENVALTQFNHRLVAYVLLGFAIFAWIRSRRSALIETKFLFQAVGLMVVLQSLIGIVTVLNAAPLGLGILHQFGAIVLWVLVILTRFSTLYPPAQSLRGKA